LLIIQTIDCFEILRFMFIRLVSQMLKHLLEFRLDLVERNDGFLLRWVDGTELDGFCGGHDGLSELVGWFLGWASDRV